MAYYALLDENNVVTQVISGRDEDEVVNGISDWEEYYGNFHGQDCKRTSINTIANLHLEGGTPFRGNYAIVGSVYDSARDAFISPQPYLSWVLNESTLMWEAPFPPPDEDLPYLWDETLLDWVLVEELPEV